MEISEIIMETFKLDTAIGLNMNASYHAGSVNKAARNKARLFFQFGCFYAGNVFLQTHEINPSGNVPKRP